MDRYTQRDTKQSVCESHVRSVRTYPFRQQHLPFDTPTQNESTPAGHKQNGTAPSPVLIAVNHP